MNNIEKEIKKIIEYRNTLLKPSDQKNEDEIDTIIDDTIDRYKNTNYDFSLCQNITINQGGKKRIVKQYAEWSTELILCIYLKRCLDKEFRVHYPNRNEHMHLLFSVISAIKDMKDYVIVKFDFEDFFNSISSEYVFKKYIVNSKLQRFQKDLFKDLVSECHYCYAGISTSNIMAEIICCEFDEQLRSVFKNSGLIFYKRYVDDGILIFNRHIEEGDVLALLKRIIDKIFYDNNFNTINKCKTKLNETIGKFTYISKRLMDDNKEITYRFNYLGYQFGLSVHTVRNRPITNIEYGITEAKIQKYTKKIAAIIDDYIVDQDIEFLRHRLRAFCCRTVYRRKHYKSMIWKSKGFIANYCELRYHLNKLDAKTKTFLEDGITNMFKKKLGYIPYFLKDTQKHPYSLYNTLEKNKTLLFEENDRIGIGYTKLMKMCEQVGISNLSNSSYNMLLRKYLIKVKVGH